MIPFLLEHEVTWRAVGSRRRSSATAVIVVPAVVRGRSGRRPPVGVFAAALAVLADPPQLSSAVAVSDDVFRRV